MPAIFKQVSCFKPGRYHIGGDLFRTITGDDIADYVRGTRELLAAGYSIPILFEHAPPGSKEGAPIQLSGATERSKRDERAHQVRHGAGWLKGLELTDDNELSLTLEATDPDAARGLKNGSIRFVSPEFRERFKGSEGREFGRSIAHVALTHTPRNPKQSPIAWQCSLADWGPFQASAEEDDTEADDNDPPATGENIAEQVSDGDATAGPEMTDTGNEKANGDMPTTKQPNGSDNPHLVSALEHLKLRGIALPEDTDSETFIRDLLTALKTLAAKEELDRAAAAEQTDVDENDGTQEYAGQGTPTNQDEMVEEKPPIQFSLADVESGACTNRLLGAVIRGAHRDAVGQIDELYKSGRITPNVARRLRERSDALQFSADGEESDECKLSLAEVLDIMKDLIEHAYAHLTTEQRARAEDDERPPLDRQGTVQGLRHHGSDGDVTPEQAKAYVDKQAERMPILQGRKT
ncbi:MAG TPA: hypothetical protein VHC22_32515 [Pirellulales bacterium]|nr:hypothetical protein [Pirellulales bacterium]